MDIYIGNQLFDTECSKNCPGQEELFSQGNLCLRCPILNCVPGLDGFCLIEPNDYRQDWAREFREWFNNGCVGYPNLTL